MLTLVTGGAASGKSEYAEALICAAPASPRIYIATMQPFDGECRARIEKHRRARAGKGFETVERFTGLSGLTLPEGCAALLECMSNLAANELYSLGGAGKAAAPEILRGVERLCGQAREVVVVSGEVFSDGVDYGPETMEYLALLGRVNREIAALADRVVEVVYGIPVFYKGGNL